MPISFSALCIISFVTRSGDGDGRGEGEATGVGVWARALNGDFEATRPAAPAAGSNFTKLRRLIDIRFCFFMEVSSNLMIRITSVSSVVEFHLETLTTEDTEKSLTWTSVLHLHNLRLACSVDSHDEEIVVLGLWNSRILWATKSFNYFRHRIVMPGNEDSL